MKKSCKGTFIVVCVIILIGIPALVYIVGELAPVFYSSRAKLIQKYNERAEIWNTQGIKEFKGNSFVVKSGLEEKNMEGYEKTFGENYPIRDKCDLKKDTKKGCLTTNAFYYRTEISTDERPQIEVNILNSNAGALIYNSTFDRYKRGFIDFDSMGCSTAESCKPICDKYGGEIVGKVCIYDTYLNEICIRVKKLPDGSFGIDIPPAWDFEYDTGLPGCDCDISWRPEYYSIGDGKKVLVSVRYYQDSYIVASSVTMGCSSKHENTTSCFPTSYDTDFELITFMFYTRLVSIGLIIIELIVVIIITITVSLKNYKIKKQGYSKQLV